MNLTDPILRHGRIVWRQKLRLIFESGHDARIPDPRYSVVAPAKAGTQVITELSVISGPRLSLRLAGTTDVEMALGPRHNNSCEIDRP